MNSLLAPVSPLLTLLQQNSEVIALIFLAITIVEIGLDFWLRKNRQYAETAANIGIGIVHDLLLSPFSSIVAFIGLAIVATISPLHIPINLGTTIVAVAIADFLYYWNHRAEHRIRFFWGYHSVHHSSTDYNLTVALRLAWVEDFILWIFYIPMVLVGFHPLHALIALQIVGIYQIWIHNQKIGRLGFLDRILNTASTHRVHHGANPIYIDKNYGGILMLWDHLFGTYQAETEKVIYGLTEPINTTNPIKINLIEYIRIGRDWQRSVTSKERFLSLFGPPEWKPSAVSKQLPHQP
jgi:sterol desaturase/sphingolipid hydroxylase (fatty acid hydroxylase superfamily)